VRRILSETGVVRRIAGELWRNTWPVIGSNVLGLVLNFADLYFAGLLGRRALLGVVVAATWTSFVHALALASFTSGVTREMTVRNARGADLAGPAVAALVSGLAIGVAACVGFNLGATTFLRAMGLSGESLGHGATYLRVMSAAFPGLFVIGVFQGVMRGLGRPALAHRVLAAGIVLSLALSPVLALGRGLGVAGLGLANLIGLTVAAGGGLAVLVRRSRSAARPAAGSRRVDWSVLGRIGRVTVPSATVWLGVSLTIALLQRMLSALGDDVLVAFSVVFRLELITGTLASAFAAAALYVVGTHYAVGQVRRAFLALRVQQLLFVAAMVPFVVLLEAWPRAWAGLFTATPGILLISDVNTRYFVLSLPFTGISQVVAASFYVFGRPTAGLRIFVVKNFILLVPALFVTVRYLGIHDLHVIFLVQLAAAPLAWLYSEALLRRWKAGSAPAGRPERPRRRRCSRARPSFRSVWSFSSSGSTTLRPSGSAPS
jgi:Na+-driven multidrug efflux pump